MVPPLAELFPDEDFRFQLHLRRGDWDAFFRPTASSLRAERTRLLHAFPERHLFAAPSAAPLITALEAKLHQEAAGSLWQRMKTLGGHFEPDLLLLEPTATGNPLFSAGAVCFPTGWAPNEKFGLPLEAIHGEVPRLNASLGVGVRSFFSRLPEDACFERTNWGLAASSELTLHPATRPPRLEADTPVSSVWIRIEDQLLAALPTRAGFVFALRLRLVPLCVLTDSPALTLGLARALRTMPDEVAHYKGVAVIRPALLRQLER